MVFTESGPSPEEMGLSPEESDFFERGEELAETLEKKAASRHPDLREAKAEALARREVLVTEKKVEEEFFNQGADEEHLAGLDSDTHEDELQKAA